jgi:hypothetical protein
MMKAKDCICPIHGYFCGWYFKAEKFFKIYGKFVKLLLPKDFCKTTFKLPASK